MQELLLAPKIFDELERGVKKVTIRKGRRDIKLGTLLFKETGGLREKSVEVWSVTYTYLDSVSHQDCKADGFKNYRELEKVMKEFYPDISHSTEVTVIRFI